MNNNIVGIYISQRPCPVCQNLKGIVIAQLDYALFDDLNISGQKTMVQCCQCGMLYDDVHFSENQLQEYYFCNEHYAASTIGGSGSISDDNNKRYDRIIDLMEIDRGGMILDFGCGKGGFVSRCIKKGLKAAGIEPSLKSREKAGILNIPIYESMDAFLIENPHCELKGLIFSHVLEHLMYPMNLFNLVAPYCRDTYVYIEVPDADFYLLPKQIVWQEMYFEHLSHFRKNNIREIARQVGIKIIQEGSNRFSDQQRDNHCRFITGRFAPKSNTKKSFEFLDQNYEPIPRFSSTKIENLPKNDSPLALWGVSQYAMLIIGSCPGLTQRPIRLFDASPAKIGRRIKDIVVESSDLLSSLSSECSMILPKSKYLSQMHRHLVSIGYKGRIIEV